MMINLALSSYQKKIAKKLGTAVGQEMLQGIESAKAAGAELVLADRDIQTTFLRIWRKLNFWEKCKLLFSLVFSFGEDADVTEDDLTELLKQDILESVLADMRKQFPKIGDILISERDQHLASKIKTRRAKRSWPSWAARMCRASVRSCSGNRTSPRLQRCRKKAPPRKLSAGSYPS